MYRLSYWSMLFVETQFCVQRANVIHLAIYYASCFSYVQHHHHLLPLPARPLSMSTTIVTRLLLSLWLPPPLSQIAVVPSPFLRVLTTVLCYRSANGFHVAKQWAASSLHLPGPIESMFLGWSFFFCYLTSVEIFLWFHGWILLL